MSIENSATQTRGTGPLDPTLVTGRRAPVTGALPTTDDSTDPKTAVKSALGTDGGSSGTYATRDGAPTCVAFDDVAPKAPDQSTTDPCGTTVTPSDSSTAKWTTEDSAALIGGQTAGAAGTKAVKGVEDAHKTANKAGESQCIDHDDKRAALVKAETAVKDAITGVDTAISALQARIDALPADSPVRASLQEQKTKLEGQKTELSQALTAAGKNITKFDAAVDSSKNRHDERQVTLASATDRVTHCAKDPAKFDADLKDLTAKYKAQFATDASVALLDEIRLAHAGGAGHDRASIQAKLAIVKQHPEKYTAAEMKNLESVVAAAENFLDPTKLTKNKQTERGVNSDFAATRIPATPHIAHSDDRATWEANNDKITEGYKGLESAMKDYLGKPEMDTWLTMGVNASGECGSVFKNSTMIGDAYDSGALDGTVAAVRGGIAWVAGADPHKFYTGLADGNREIYNTIAPAMRIFLEAEQKGEDGVAAVKNSAFFKKLGKDGDPEHASYANTGELIKGLQKLQEAHKATTPEAKAQAIYDSSIAIAKYEQHEVLAPILKRPDVKAQLAAGSGALKWTTPYGDRPNLLTENFADWGDYGTRMDAITKVAETYKNHNLGKPEPAYFKDQDAGAP